MNISSGTYAYVSMRIFSVILGVTFGMIFGHYFKLSPRLPISSQFDLAVRDNAAMLANRIHSIFTKGIFHQLKCLTRSFNIRSNLNASVKVNCRERTYLVMLTQWTHNTHKGNLTIG